MSGRAGRRGLDTTGMVIVACPEGIPDVIYLILTKANADY